jgi:hypothetical protein
MMGRRTTVAAIAAAVAIGLVVPAAAQFGWIFGDPPRPPSNVPGARPQQPYPQQPDYPPPPANYPPANYPPPPDYQPGGQPPGVQSRPLPPPSGAALDPAPRAPLPPPPGAALDPAPRAPLPPPPGSAPTNLAPNLGLAPGPGPGPAPRGPRGPADTSPQPGDEVITEPPQQRIANKSALFSGLDKITGRIISFDVAIGETVQFGALQVTPRTCFTRPTTETQNTDAFIEVEEVTLQGEVRRIFTGWVFAASPGLHAVEHPIYDIWLTDCKSPVVVAEPVVPAPTPAAAPPPRNPPAQPKQKQAPKQQPQQQTQGFPPFR